MIYDISVLQIYNSRGEKTIKVYVKTDDGVYSSCAPSGKSVSSYEAKVIAPEKVLKVMKRIKRVLVGQDSTLVDKKLEKMGGKNFEKIGGNLAIAISQAVIRAQAKNNVYKLLNPKAKHFPYPLGNVIGGGAHGGGTDIQEFLIFSKTKTLKEAIEKNFSVWERVKEALGRDLCGRNDEGAWISKLNDLKTLDLISEIAEEFSCKIGVDFAASQLFKKGNYIYPKLERRLSPEEQLDFVIDLIKTYDISYVEDPFHEHDFSSFAELTKRTNCIIVGDDIFASNHVRLKKAIKKGAGNAIIIKPNQAGTISRTLKTVRLAKDYGFLPVVSHRSGETCDSFIADLAVGISAPLIKCGISGSERVSKLNRLLEIWKEIKRPRMAKLKI